MSATNPVPSISALSPASATAGGAAFILTRPLGATVGDFLDKPHASGGLALSRYAATAVLAAFIVTGVYFFPGKAERRTPS